MKKVIDSFRDEHSFLSNFYYHPMTINASFTYRTVEHFYQASKARTKIDHIRVMSAISPAEAKRKGRKVQLRDDWEEIREEVMWKGLVAKFSNVRLRNLLIGTYPAKLVEGNWWKDTYWGVDHKTGEGQNRLGELLMKLRKELMSV